MIAKVVGLLLVLTSKATSKVEFKNCYTQTVLQFSITKFPDPFILEAGRNFTVSLGMKNSVMLPDSLKVNLDLWRKAGVWVPLPCLFGAGSCSCYVTCKTVSQLCQFRQMCKNCGLSVEDMQFQLPKDTDVKVPSFIINGKYWVKVMIRNAYNNLVIGCFELYFTLKKPLSQI